MSFYGNISNAGKTNLTFDKIYSNRRQMEANIKTDGVFVNRFVLIEYDDNTFSRKRGFIDEELNGDLIHLFKNGELTDENNRFEVYYDSERRIPYMLEGANIEHGYGVESYELIEVECESDTLYFHCTEEIGLDQTGRKFVICKIMDTSIDPSYALSDYALNYQLDEEWSRKERDLYEGFHTAQGWDSTIWQKVIESGKEKYRMVGTLNSKPPIFKIKPEAPSMNPVAPHFGISNNSYYDLHLQPNWGFKVKKAEPFDVLDENGEVISQRGPYTDQHINFKVKQYNPLTKTDELVTGDYDGAIYFNKDGFKPDKRSKVTDVETEFSLLPTGYSVEKDELGRYEKKYISHSENGQVFEAAPDIQELTVHLPDIGNAISDLWDLVYGEYEYENGKLKLDEKGKPIYKEYRNLDINWNSIAGTRLVTEDERYGGFYYNDEKTQTIAGSINSIHDLMGMIIVDNEGITELGAADTEHIYYGDYGNKGYKSFYIKTPKCTYIEIPEKHYENMVGMRTYFNLTQYQPNIYYTKNYKNYYLKTDPEAPLDSHVYSLDPIFIQLKDWDAVEIPEDLEDRKDLVLSHYYKDENGNYIFDDGEEATFGREYFSITTQQATFPKGDKNTTVTTEVYNPSPRIVDKVVNGKEFYIGYVYFKYREVEDEFGNITKEYLDEVYELVPQAYEYDSEGKAQLKFVDEEKTIPMWDYSKVSEDPYPDDPDGLKREYFYVDNYYLHYVTSIDGLDQAIYYGNNAMNSGNMPPESERVVFIKFEKDHFYLPEDSNYLNVKEPTDCDKTIIYYTVEATKETGMLPLEKPEDEEDPEAPETPEVFIDTQYYVKNKYYYKYGNNYLFGYEETKQEGFDYYIIPLDLQPLEVEFYRAETYTYDTVIDDKVVSILDMDLIMKTSSTPNVITDETTGLVYYIKSEPYIISDSSGILSPGSIWNSNTFPPDTIKIGTLYSGGDFVTYDELGNLKSQSLTSAEQAEKLYQWTELKGFSRTLNTINGLIVKLNQVFDFDNTLTRDRSTIQGMMNTINDVINDFGELNPGEFTIIDEYGRIKSAKMLTTAADGSDEEGWINVEVNPKVNETQISIRHNDAKAADGVLGQLQNQNLTFGDTFKAISFGIDDKGHVPSGQFKEYTMTMPKLDVTDNDTKQVITDLSLSENGQSLVLTRENVGNLTLTGYEATTLTDDVANTDTVNSAFGKLQSKLNKEITDRIADVDAEEQARIEAINALSLAENSSSTQFISSIKQDKGKVTVSRADAGTLVLGTGYVVASESAGVNTTDSINSAVGKLEYKLNILNAGSTQPGSVAYQIAQIVEADQNGSIDKLNEIAAWIVSDTTGAAKMNADIKELERLVGDTEVAIQISNAINAALAGDSDGTLKYALASDLTALSEDVKDLEKLIDSDKVSKWDSAQPNVISDWNETDSTSDKFIANKPDLTDYVKTSTTFTYTSDDGSTTEMTIAQLFNYITTLEERIKVLETPSSEG